MVILSSSLLVFIITLFWLLFPLLKKTYYKQKHTAEDITFYIIHALLFFPIPKLLLGERNLHTVVLRSIDDMVEETHKVFTSELLYINYFLLLFITTLSIWLYIKKAKSFNFNLIVRDKWYYLIILLNIGFFHFSIDLKGLLYPFIFIVFTLFAQFNPFFIKKIITEILALYIYLSFLVVVLKPEAGIFADGTWAGIFTNPNSMIIAVNFTLILLLLLPYYSKTRAKWRYINIGLLFYLMLMSGSRNGLLTFLLILGLFIIHYKKLHYFYIILLFIALPLSVWFYDIFNTIDFNDITSSRSSIWVYLLGKLDGHYLLGMGHNYFSPKSRATNFSSYFFSQTNAMNIYIEYLVKYGVLGLSIMIGFTVSLYNKAKKVDSVLLIFVILLVLPNLFESFFKPPTTSINNVVYLLMIFIVNNSKLYFKPYRL